MDFHYFLLVQLFSQVSFLYNLFNIELLNSFFDFDKNQIIDIHHF